MHPPLSQLLGAMVTNTAIIATAAIAAEKTTKKATIIATAHSTTKYNNQ